MSDALMPEHVKRAIIAAVEDDRFMLARAAFALIGQVYEVDDLTEIETIPRDISTSSASLNKLPLVDVVVEYAKREDHPTDVFAVSMFGTVGLDDGIVRHVPGSGPDKLIKLSLDLPYLLRTRTQSPQTIVYVENDASAAALGESIAGAGQGLNSFAYVWLGRGINVGLILGREIWRGRLHPEAGHSLVRVLTHDDLAMATCGLHQDCLVGRASLESIEQRLEIGADKSKVRSIVSDYVAQLCMNTVLFAAPQAIAIGGYTVREDILVGLIDETNKRFSEYIGVYPSYSDNIDPTRFIVPARLGPESSILGMLEVTRRNLTNRSTLETAR